MAREGYNGSLLSMPKNAVAKRLLPWYIGTMPETPKYPIQRVQTGVRMERRLVKVLKALAEYLDISLGDLLEGIVLHAFDDKTPFGEPTLAKIAELKSVYDLDLDSSASHRMTERGGDHG